MCSSVILESLFIPFSFSLEYDLLMTWIYRKKYKKERNKEHSDVFVLDILFHQACVVIRGLFTRFIIEGLYEFSMRTFSLHESLSLSNLRDESFS